MSSYLNSVVKNDTHSDIFSNEIKKFARDLPGGKFRKESENRVSRMALKGLRVIEMAGLAPVPYCGQVLADYG